MRCIVVGVGLLGLVQAAGAADLPEFALRGTEAPSYHWGGGYVGGQIGYSSAGVDFGNGVSSEIDYALRNTRINQDVGVSSLTVMGKKNTNGTSFGGFAGYNFEFEDTIVGVEANYSRMDVHATASDTIARLMPDTKVSPNYVYDTAVNGQSSIHLTDLLTLRARGGWEIGWFMPYGFLGLAVGRADISSSATVAFCGYDPTDATQSQDPVGCYNTATQTATRYQAPPQSQTKLGEFIYGGAAGLGIEAALLPNLFVRGEWEYVQFAPIQGMHVQLQNFRTGAGLLF